MVNLKVWNLNEYILKVSFAIYKMLRQTQSLLSYGPDLHEAPHLKEEVLKILAIVKGFWMYNDHERVQLDT